MLGFLAAAAPAVIGGIMGASKQKAQDSAAKAAAAEQNKLAKEKAEKMFARAQQEYELDWQQNLTKFYWEQAAVEQARFVQAQSATDQARSNGRMIYGVAQAYMNQAEGLRAQYVDQELLRGKQEMLQLQQTVGMGAVKNRQIVAGVQQEVAKYLFSVADNSFQAQGLVDRTEGEVDKLMTELATAEMTGNFEFNASVIAAAMDFAVQSNVALTASGGSKSAKAVAQNGMKRALMEYGKVHLARGQRTAMVGQMNTKMTGEVAMALQGLATQSAGFVEQSRLAQKAGKIAVDGNTREMQYAVDVFQKLTIPSFKLANDQYKRELQTLQLGVSDQLWNATLPIRQTQYFDPLMPIKGIAPSLELPTPVRAQTGGFMGMAGAALQGAQALSPNMFSTLIPNALGSLFGGGGMKIA